MKVLIIGSGGREHALAWKIKQSALVSQVFVAPGNAGTAQIAKNVAIAANDLPGLVKFAQQNKIELTVVGPEEPLVLGIVDLFTKHGLKIFGPTKKAARLEGSKIFAKKFMKRFKIPTAKFRVFTSRREAKTYLKTAVFPQVIKADGLAAGKGVTIARNYEEAVSVLQDKVVIEEYLTGEEVSVIGLSDGQRVVPWLAAQDYKPINEANQGPNTGGMGAYAPVAWMTAALMKTVQKQVFQPMIKGMKQLGCPYQGFIYAGLILTAQGIKVLEFNCRLGDPETQPQLMLLDADLVKLILATLTGSLSSERLRWYPGAAVCVVMASKGYPGKYLSGFPIEGLASNYPAQLQVFQAGTKMVKNQVVTAAGRVLGITSRGKDLEQAVDRVYQQAKKIRFKNHYYRRDIGARTVNRLAVRTKIKDMRAKKLSQELGAAVEIRDVYTIKKRLSQNQLKELGERLINPETQALEINRFRAPQSFSWAVEIGFLPGVTDNVANTVKEEVGDDAAVYSSRLLFVKDKLSRQEIEKRTSRLYNPLIKQAKFKPAQQFRREGDMDVKLPQVKLAGTNRVQAVNLEISEADLARLGKEGIIDEKSGKRRGPLALNLESLKTIRAYFRKKKRWPTDVEMESLAQTWSEHCKHTIFADPLDEIKEGIFQRYIKGATEKIRQLKGAKDICVSVFKDNSGAIEFDKNWLITDKVETHNSPSALDPFGGSITGIVGVNRDTIGFGMGAKPVINRYGFCFASPDDKTRLFRGPEKTQEMLSSQRIISGVVEGVNSGGNCSGIPTPQGFVYFDKSFRGKPLVFVGTVGLIPKKVKGRSMSRKKARPNDLIVMVGGRVGLDGIHGATFSSEAMSQGSPASAVQIGDPITQKKLSDALVKEARDKGWYNSITDNGAGGLSCSVAEMAKESGGCEVELSQVPVKYPGLEPWQIWISESQERMTLAVPKSGWVKFKSLMERRGVEATVIGKFTASGKCVVKNQGKKVMEIEMDFLHDGLPSRQRWSKAVQLHYPEPKIKQRPDLTKVVKQMLAQPNISSFSWISQQFDHEVQGGSVIKPLQGKNQVNGEATVTKPLLTSKKGVVVSQGINPRLSLIDTYWMAANAIDMAIRNAIATGADINKLALLDNFCWCSSEEPESLYQLKQAVKACYQFALGYLTPFISGKDSMFNDFKGFDGQSRPLKISILPTLLISAIGIIDQAEQAVSLEAKMVNDLVYVLGETKDELGGSEYFNLFRAVGNCLPKLDAKKNRQLYQRVSQAVQQGWLASAIAVTKGGLAVALSKTALAAGLGLKIDLDKVPGNFSRNDYGLFSESAGRLVVTVNPENQAKFEKLMSRQPLGLIGKVIQSPRLIISRHQVKIVDLNLCSK